MMFLHRMLGSKKTSPRFNRGKQFENRQSEVIVDQVKKLLQQADQNIILMVRR